MKPVALSLLIVAILVFFLSQNVTVFADIASPSTSVRELASYQCCKQYESNDSEFNSITCCLNSINVSACNACIYINLSEGNKQREKENLIMYSIVISYFILLIGSFMTLVINKIVKIKRGVGFLSTWLSITLWIIFTLLILVTALYLGFRII